MHKRYQKEDHQMKKITRRQFLKTTAAVGALGAAASAGAVPAGACIDPPPAAGYPQQITIGAYDWGPCVSSTQFKLRQSVRAESVQASDFQSAYETKDSYDWYQTSAGTATASGTLPVVDACPCNSDGFRAASARMLRLEFSPVKQDANVVGSVFRFDPVQHTTSWCSDYTLSIQLSKDASLSAALFGLPVTKVEVNPAIDFSRARIPALDSFRLDGKFTGSDGRTLLYASYEPSGAVEVPLVVWLHSGEECGSDVRIPLLAEKVSALAGKAFQDALGGSAFVLVPQTSEVWDDAQVLTLRELIEQFAAEHPNLDRTRIYLGGSGAGGAMTLKMLLQAPDFFAAAFPISETCPDAALSEAQITALSKTPLWFTYAKDWLPADPGQYTAATVRRLQRLNAPVRQTAWEQAPEQAGNVFYRNRLGTIYCHEGDWSWIYFFNDQCVDDATGEHLWQWLGQQKR